MKSVTVRIYESGPFFVAQGVEVDYLAQGRTVEEATDAFIMGFEWTIAANVQRFGHARHFLKPVPSDPPPWIHGKPVGEFTHRYADWN